MKSNGWFFLVLAVFMVFSFPPAFAGELDNFPKDINALVGNECVGEWNAILFGISDRYYLKINKGEGETISGTVYVVAPVNYGNQYLPFGGTYKNGVINGDAKYFQFTLKFVSPTRLEGMSVGLSVSSVWLECKLKK